MIYLKQPTSAMSKGGFALATDDLSESPTTSGAEPLYLHDNFNTKPRPSSLAGPSNLPTSPHPPSPTTHSVKLAILNVSISSPDPPLIPVDYKFI